MQKFMKISNWSGHSTTIRMVNQPEIVEHLKKNPGLTEDEIFSQVYSYSRCSSPVSNKKYAECLRRALHKGTVSRVKGIKYNKTYYLYFAV
jgi:hypothetical protein